MTDRLDDVWVSRDFPVLVEITRRIDSGERFFRLSSVADELGWEVERVALAVQALERRDLVAVTKVMGGFGSWHVDDVAGAAYLLTGLHPDGDDAVSALVDALRQAADETADPDERSRLRRLADSALGVSREVLAGVLVNLASRGMLGA